MPDARTATDTRPPTATVCTCGYDLAGLPEDAAGKCPECGALIAEIVLPVPRFHHWGRRVATGMTPAACWVGAIAIDIAFPRSFTGHGWQTFLMAAGLACWIAVSAPGFARLAMRAVRVSSLPARCVVAAVGAGISLVANVLVMVMTAMAVG